MVGDILQQNHDVEFELETKAERKSFVDFTVQHFLDLTIGRVFQESKIAGCSGNLKRQCTKTKQQL